MTRNPEEGPLHGSVHHLNPETLHKNPAFTQVITVTGPARTIYIGGQDAVDAQGKIVGKGDLAAQTHQVLRNVRTALAAASARPEHIIKWNVYLVQGQSLQAGFTAFQQFWGDQPDPPTIDFHLRLRAGTPGFSGGDGCHCRRSALAPGDEQWKDGSIGRSRGWLSCPLFTLFTSLRNKKSLSPDDMRARKKND